MHQLSRQVQEAVTALQQCHTTCLSMATVHCLEMGGEHAKPQHIRLMLDCAAMCAFTSDALVRKSQFHNRFAALCAEVCKTCAEDCGKIGDMDECEAGCRRCAEHCEAVARSDHADIISIGSRTPPG